LSTGAAGDFDLDNALLRGIYEIVERDAFMIAWLLRVKLPRVDLNLLENRTPVDIAERFRQYRLSPYVFDMTNDLAIPAYLTILRDETGIGPPVTVGLKAGYDRCRAIEGSLLESFSPRPWLRMQAPHAAGMPAFANPLTIDTFSKRAAYWRKPSALKSLEYLTAQQPQRIAAAPDKGPESLSGTVQRLKNFGYDLWYVPLSNEVLESTGYQVVKVVAPGLQPLYLKEADKEVRSERLSRAASFFALTASGQSYSSPFSLRTIDRKNRTNSSDPV
jgi:ribosomal protein S12 methylthiotransferase accessory factor